MPDPIPDPPDSPQPAAPSRQHTDEEIQERVDFCRAVMRRTRRKTVIRAEFNKQFGQTYWGTVDGYCARAREQARLEHERTRSELRADLAEVLQGVMEDGRGMTITAAAREYARLNGLNLEAPPLEQLCTMLGLSAAELADAVARYRRDKAALGDNPG
jgi:hypothetical protein